MDSDNVSSMAKRLASCRKSTRERAFILLKDILSCPNISDDELLRVWKSIFNWVWHADKIPVQTYLIDRLSSVIVSLDFSLASRYFHGFLVTVGREWSGIDHERLEKFYLLIRRFVNQLFLLLQSHEWDSESVGSMVGVLGERWIISDEKEFPAQGVNYHISQVFLDEIMGFLPLKEGTMLILLSPFFRVMESSVDKVFVKKIKDNVFGRMYESGVRCLNELKKNKKDCEDDEILGKVVLSLVCMGFPEMFLCSASAAGTLESNRKVLFGLHKQFLKLENDLKLADNEVSLELNHAIWKQQFETMFDDDKRKKLKRSKSNGKTDDHDEDGKIAKRVRFASPKKNLFWNPQLPLPPESLRLPPSLAPRGSALKKGIPPGPVDESLTLLPSSSSSSKKKVKAEHRSIRSTEGVM